MFSKNLFLVVVASILTCTSFAQRPKILCLHGGGGNGGGFKWGLNDLEKSLPDYEFVFADGGYPVPGSSKNTYLWMPSPPSKDDPTTTPEIADTSIANLNQIVAEQGPFAGILGFSQGAAFVPVYLAIAPVGTFEFAMIFCGYLTETHRGLLDLVNAQSPFGDIRTLIWIGERDDLIVPKMSQALIPKFTSPTVVSSTCGGHSVPGTSDSTFNQVTAFVLGTDVTANDEIDPQNCDELYKDKDKEWNNDKDKKDENDKVSWKDEKDYDEDQWWNWWDDDKDKKNEDWNKDNKKEDEYKKEDWNKDDKKEDEYKKEDWNKDDKKEDEYKKEDWNKDDKKEDENKKEDWNKDNEKDEFKEKPNMDKEDKNKEECSDDPEFKYRNKPEKNCEWVQTKGTKCNFLHKRKPISAYCPAACGMCKNDEDDEQQKDKEEKEDWNKDSKKDELEGEKPSTKSCVNTPGFRYKKRGRGKNCAWVKLKQNRRCDLYWEGEKKVWEACPVSCKNYVKRNNLKMKDCVILS